MLTFDAERHLLYEALLVLVRALNYVECRGKASRRRGIQTVLPFCIAGFAVPTKTLKEKFNWAIKGFSMRRDGY